MHQFSCHCIFREQILPVIRVLLGLKQTCLERSIQSDVDMFYFVMSINFVRLKSESGVFQVRSQEPREGDTFLLLLVTGFHLSMQLQEGSFRNISLQ